MSEELSTPSVVDFDALLTPIEGENPAGQYLRYSGVYDEISEARRADDTVVANDYESTGKTADFRQVVSLAKSALESESKDMQIAAWYSEALVKLYGFSGLRDALRMMTALQENFWDSLHPQVEDGDMEGRANAISWMDDQCAFAVKQAAITNYAGYSFFDFEDSKRFDLPENLDAFDEAEQTRLNDLKNQAETEGRVTAQKWAQEVANTRRAFYEEITKTIAECWAEYKKLNASIEARFDAKQMPSMQKVYRALEDVEIQVRKLHEQKKLEEPYADEIESEGEAGEAGEGGGTGKGPVKSRQEALKRLSEVAEFFKRTEPHSPVSYLVQRAVKWGNMPLESWLQDVIKDDNALYTIRETLGLNTGGSSDGDY